MTADLTFSDQKIMLRLLEGSDQVGFVKSDLDGKIKYINSVGRKLFEVKDSFLEVQQFFVDSDDWQDLKYRLNRGLSFQNIIYLLRSSSNRSYWMDVSIKITEQADVYWILKDISSLQKQQQELSYQRAMLEKSKNEMDRIIYSASHDLRSPITSILGLLNLLGLTQSEQEKNEYIFMMQSSVMKLDSLIQNLGRLSKNSNEVVRDAEINFEDLLDEIQTELSFHSNFLKIEFQKSLSQQHIFYSDQERIKLMLGNIIKNCLDFMDSNKSRNIVDIEIKVTDEKVVVKIFDNGIGISKSNVDRVFDLFYRGSDRSRGSGLGLFESKEIIVKLGGKIKLNSEYSIGTSIELDIPNSKKGKLINKKKALRY